MDQIFPRTAPFCDVDLQPKWDYDLEKAQLLNNCPVSLSAAEEDDGTNKLAIGLGVAFGLLATVLFGVAAHFHKKNKELQYKLVSLTQTPAVPSAAQDMQKVVHTTQAVA